MVGYLLALFMSARCRVRLYRSCNSCMLTIIAYPPITTTTIRDFADRPGFGSHKRKPAAAPSQHAQDVPPPT